jgi:hypothetical protein
MGVWEAWKWGSSMEHRLVVIGRANLGMVALTLLMGSTRSGAGACPQS